MSTETTPDVVFTAFVHLTDEQGHRHAFGPGDPIPDWARPLVGEHVIGPRDGDAGDGREWVPPPASLPDDQWAEPGADADGADGADGGDDEGFPVEYPVPPPTSGPGSGQAAWFKFARACGEAEPTPSWSRQDIIDLLIRRGHLTD